MISWFSALHCRFLRNFFAAASSSTHFIFQPEDELIPLRFIHCSLLQIPRRIKNSGFSSAFQSAAGNICEIPRKPEQDVCSRSNSKPKMQTVFRASYFSLRMGFVGKEAAGAAVREQRSRLQPQKNVSSQLSSSFREEVFLQDPGQAALMEASDLLLFLVGGGSCCVFKSH